MASDYVLEVANVFHSGQVEKGTQIQKLIGAIRTGVILKDVSMSSFGGELSAVLGSKGSGKRAFLDVISRRAQGPTRGQIMLNGVPMSMRLFQDSCGFVGKSQDLLHGLTVRQTLSFTIELSLGSKISADSKSSRVKQILADFALTDLRNRLVEDLNKSEYRRLAIAKNLVRDPVLLLLDEPTNDLNPLDAYFVISILANHAKQNNRIIILTIEKPRSDIFPFLDRATYLCLGDVVYTGPTRMMLEYFRSIGFPCPELENPLMYYRKLWIRTLMPRYVEDGTHPTYLPIFSVCLSTVDRRSRERFVESNNQIASLVEKFKIEGVHYQHLSNTTTTDIKTKIPLTAFGRPSTVVKIWILLRAAGFRSATCYQVQSSNCNHCSVLIDYSIGSVEWHHQLKTSSLIALFVLIFRYINGTHYLQETYGLLTVNLDELMNVWHNALISVSFFVGMFALNLVLYVLPIPLFIKLKFREEITEA
eukprot:TCALIF_09948-PA protein Name:"Similar to Abcg5 ATP-binding cassette sub-family G member 5 (Rattus norvegicus)" AED:0.33 eAED:0.39 QI:0/0/0/1/0.75/0.8/5/0/476